MPRLDLAPAAVLALFALLGAALAGCGGEGATSAAPTYHRDVAPIVAAKCAGCHADGGIAPFPLTTFAEVSAAKAGIAAAVTARTMPPWPPADGCTEYKYNRALSDEQIDTINAWVQGGAPEGDPADAPAALPSSAPRLSRIDRELEMPAEFSPTLSPDQNRCFSIDWPETETRYVTGFGVKPGNGAIVHHVIAFLATPDQVATFQALDAADPGPGWDCFGGPTGNVDAAMRAVWLGSWVPGSVGGDFPAGTGIEIAPGSKIVLQVHYNTSSAPPAPDRTKVLLKVEDAVEKKAFVMPFTNPDWPKNKTMDIPAHATDATHAFAGDPTPVLGVLSNGVIPANAPFTLYTTNVHMHTRGTRGLNKIVRGAGGEECMLDVEEWSFHWQSNYTFATPKRFAPGDQLSLECHFHNMDPMDVNWGEGTSDEMCLSTFYITE
jgi:mono/diheme cytochrome c family protein